MEISIQNKISWETKGRIGYLTFIDEPENKMDSLFFKEMNQLTNEIIPESKVKAIIIHGKGRHFSSGANLDELIEKVKNEKRRIEVLSNNYNSFLFFEKLNIPVIAVIRGVCLGSAFELALHCHFRLCSEDALLGLPESSFGLMPGAGGIPKLMQIAGHAKTIEMAIRGNIFNAQDALKWGIIDLVFPKNEVLRKAESLIALAKVNYRKYNKKEYLSNLLSKIDIKE